MLPLGLNLPGFENWWVIAIIGLLLFGKRLPEVGRSLGKGIVEFKKGLKGIEDEVTQSSAQADSVQRTPQQAKFDPYTGAPIQPKFDPYTGKPLNTEPANSQTLPPTT